MQWHVRFHRLFGLTAHQLLDKVDEGVLRTADDEVPAQVPQRAHHLRAAVLFRRCCLCQQQTAHARAKGGAPPAPWPAHWRTVRQDAPTPSSLPEPRRPGKPPPHHHLWAPRYHWRCLRYLAAPEPLRQAYCTVQLEGVRTWEHVPGGTEVQGLYYNQEV